jgi:hypothetical protein
MTDDLERAVRDALANDPTIGAAVTDLDGTVRIYPTALKQESGFPALTYHRVSTTRNATVGSYAHSGGSAGYTGVAWARISITIWSPEFGDTVTLGAAVVKLIHALDLAGSGQVMNKVLLQRYAREPESDVHQHVIDAQIWFVESI